MERRFELALRDFESALGRLHEVLDLGETEIVRDALIKRFEFTFETGWKAMKLAVEVAIFGRTRGVGAFDAALATLRARAEE